MAGAIKTVGRRIYLLQADPMNVNQVSEAFDCSNHDTGSFQVNWTGNNGAVRDGVFQVEVSNDKVNWIAKTSALYTIVGGDAAAASRIINVHDLVENYCRMNFSKNTMTAGTCEVVSCFKTIGAF